MSWICTLYCTTVNKHEISKTGKLFSKLDPCPGSVHCTVQQYINMKYVHSTVQQYINMKWVKLESCLVS